MFQAQVYTIAIFSLSGMMEEVYAAKESVCTYNQSKASSSGKLFLLVDDPGMADILVGIVGNRIENTDLIEDSLKAGKQVMLFFNPYQDPKNTIPSEQKEVAEFRNSIEERCFYKEYNSVAELCGLLSEIIESFS